MAIAPPIRQPQARRLATPSGIREIGAMRFKAYTMLFDPTPRREAILRADLARLDDELHRIAEDIPASAHGAGFCLLHIGEHASWLLCDWWGDECLLHQRIFRRGFDEHPFEPEADSTIIGCTWELGLTAHERDAWCRHVLYNNEKPDIEAYLADTFEGSL